MWHPNHCFVHFNEKVPTHGYHQHHNKQQGLLGYNNDMMKSMTEDKNDDDNHSNDKE